MKESRTAIDTRFKRVTPQLKLWQNIVCLYRKMKFKPTAVGIANVIIWAFYFWKKDVADDYYLRNPDYYLRQSFQKLIYRLNQPFLRIDQSSFTNISIFDRYYIEALFGGMIYPDDTCVIDYVDEIIECEKIFMEVVSSIRKQNMFTFPVEKLAA